MVQFLKYFATRKKYLAGSKPPGSYVNQTFKIAKGQALKFKTYKDEKNDQTESENELELEINNESNGYQSNQENESETDKLNAVDRWGRKRKHKIENRKFKQQKTIGFYNKPTNIQIKNCALNSKIEDNQESPVLKPVLTVIKVVDVDQSNFDLKPPIESYNDSSLESNCLSGRKRTEKQNNFLINLNESIIIYKSGIFSA
ncbi:unnamed protein product, partial [Brachionus calyciflorus]